MSVGSNFAASHLKSSLAPHRNLAVLQRRAFQGREYRIWRRRRIKTNRNLVVRSQLGPLPFENLFDNLLSQFPSVNSLDLIAPALGFSSGVALYLSRLKSNRNSPVSVIGEWILFTSPTPFNRFVMLRCPSISFEGSEFLEDVNEKLVKEDRHFVRLNSGRIQLTDSDEREDELEEKLVYQRECVGTEDGGVISLDWPANLDFTEERGLDTTLLLIPGTAEGSMDKNIRSFVCESLKRGCFPVVMNPRGCAGSPLTTARLFTAADSDDICTAIQFITKARPWTTLMGVGWGYGANMLTKYLAEVGERTPLAAATSIDNPFDLEEATRSSPHHMALDQKLKGGLVGILRSNKELFQGRAKGYDVEKALSAKSVRDFEKAISMISYGFDAIEDFYAKSSTRSIVGNVNIPVLFIQNDDGTVPLFSIPRGLIAENPFTSLLLCSLLPSRTLASGRSAISWYQHLTIEWLAAVELGLLKGRHPLLKDVDVTINPSKGLEPVEGRVSYQSGRVGKQWNLSRSSIFNGYAAHPLEEMLEGNHSSASIGSRFGQDTLGNSDAEDSQQKINSAGQQASSGDVELAKQEVSTIDDERGQVLQTAQVVMNMLDVTMPGTLTEEQKKKALTAVFQGETVMKALQDAVPDDVRGKLTTAVSGILHNQGTNLKLDALLNISSIPNVASGLKSKIQEKVGLSSSGGYDNPQYPDQRIRVDDLANDNQVAMEKPTGELEPELQDSDAMQSPMNNNQFQSCTYGGEVKNPGSMDVSREEVGQHPEYNEGGSDLGAKLESPSLSERVIGTEEVTMDKPEVDQGDGLRKSDMKEESNIQQNAEKVPNSSADQNKAMPSTNTEEELSDPISSTEAQLMEKEGSDNVKKEEKTNHSSLNQNSDSPTFSVSHAFDALTGMDDSTQVAVNSVFGVIEDVITQLEEENDNNTEVDDDKESEGRATDSVSENHRVTNDYTELSRKEEYKIDPNSEPDMLDNRSLYEGTNPQNNARARLAEEKPTNSPATFKANNVDSPRKNGMGSNINKVGNGRREHLVGSKPLAGHSDKVTQLYNTPLYITTNPYTDPLYKEYLQKYLLSKVQNTKPLDLDRTTTLFLDYFPEEGQWKLLEHPGSNEDSAGDAASDEGVNEVTESHSPPEADNDEFIETSYVIMDAEQQQEPIRNYNTAEKTNPKVVISNDTSDKLTSFVKNIILDSLKVEVGRRLSAVNMEDVEPNLAREMTQVANAVSLAAGHGKKSIWFLDGEDCSSDKLGTLNGEEIINTISFAIQETNYLRRVLPVGVIVGSSLAALRKFFNVATANGIDQSDSMVLDQINQSVGRNQYQLGETEADQFLRSKIERNCNMSKSRDEEKAESKKLSNGTVIVGAVTAAVGASAFLANQQDSDKGKENSGTLSKSFEEKKSHQKEPDKLEESSEKGQSNIVTSLAEKAMSVAGPVVPMKDDGEVDHERLVAMLAELGQKGGMLRLVGKIALLWGGLRGAVSLTGRLISFLHIAERPLFQRIVGFPCMVLVLWSPVVVPLLPTLVQGWATHNPSKFAELVCIIGLYASIMLLVMLWGKRIRGYENPFKQYGLDLTSLSKFQNFLKGLVGGVLLVALIHSLNASLGCVSLSWPSSFGPCSSDAMAWVQVYGKIFLLVSQGFMTATAIALVEELLFRAWLPDEIATDLGSHRGNIISGLVFSLSQRSPWAIPGLWLLSLGLAGARQRSQGSLSIPIGLRAGILASSFVLQTGSFLTYQPNFPLWVTGTHPFQPFSGIAGLAFSLLFAISLYPREPQSQKK